MQPGGSEIRIPMQGRLAAVMAGKALSCPRFWGKPAPGPLVSTARRVIDLQPHYKGPRE